MNLLFYYNILFGSGWINVSNPFCWLLIFDGIKPAGYILEISNKFYDEISGIGCYGCIAVFQPIVS